MGEMMKNNFMRNSKGQEEMVGFALIVIIVAIIILVFLSFSLKAPQKEEVESYEIDNFIQTALQYTSDCQDNLDYLSVERLITRCYGGKMCLDGRSTCEVLDLIMAGIMEESWSVDRGSVIKGYALNITSEAESILALNKGNSTGKYKGDEVLLGTNDLAVRLTIYY